MTTSWREKQAVQPPTSRLPVLRPKPESDVLSLKGKLLHAQVPTSYTKCTSETLEEPSLQLRSPKPS